MYKILVVDDEEMIRALIRKIALFEGHTVHEAENGMEAVEMCRKEPFDIVIMDIMMPELDGFSAAKTIRAESNVPILMLSARGEEYDRVNGFQLGADDYVVKPFSPRELMLRVDAIMKRYRDGGKPVENAVDEGKEPRDTVRIEGLTVDMTARTVYVDGQRRELSPKEYELLFYMLRNRGIALSRDRLLREVWGYDFFGDDRTLDTHIKLLRKSLAPYSDYIVTLRGVGYRFEKETGR